MRRVLLPIEDVNPFDPHHLRCGRKPGFLANDKQPLEHLHGAEYCRDLIHDGAPIRPIAVCAMEVVPDDKRSPDPRDSGRPWQRLDGFKRYWGHKLAGVRFIPCEVHDEYRPGIQHGQTMTIKEEPMGEIKHVLSEARYEARRLPYADRFIVEDCVNETVHVHLGNIRTEFTPDQFLWYADRMTEAAAKMRKIRGL